MKPPVKFARCDVCPFKEEPLVPGYGKQDSPDIAFVAEAPGATEVEQGRPLIGRSGQFLRRVMSDIGLDEDKCYFTNIVSCRPPGNATPKGDSIKACEGRLIEELMRVKPKLIVALGAISSKSLTQHKLPITRSHGMYREVELRFGLGSNYTVGVVPTYHPAYILRGGLKGGAEGFRDFVEELEYAKSILEGQPAIIAPPYDNYEHITTQAQFDGFVSELRLHRLVACDIETETMDFFTGRILCIGFSWKRGTAHVVDWALLEQNVDNTRKLNSTLAGVSLAFQNGVYDVPFMLHAGLTNTNYYLDTMQAHYLLDERQGTHGLERLAIKWYRAPAYKTAFRESMGIRGFKSDDVFAGLINRVSQEALFNYNGADVDYTYRLAVDLTKLVEEDGQLSVLRDIEMPACRTFTEFTMTGLLVDRDYLERLGKEWGDEESSLVAQMTAQVGDPKFNPNSPKQLAHYMYDVLGLLPFGGKDSTGQTKIDEGVISKFIQTVDDPEAREYWTSKRTATSESAEGSLKGISPRTTSAYMLYWLRQQHEFPNMVLKWRHVRKRMSLYYTALKEHMYLDGRVRPQYDLTATRTGRKSSKKPAMHNLPRGDEIYNIFIPDPGWCLIHADYAQGEMRCMAFYSGDKALLHLLKTTDIHTRMAMEMFNLTQEDIDKMPKDELSDKRIAAKMITFGLPYGRSAAGLAPQLGISKEEAALFIQRYFALVPRLEQWIKEQRARGIEDQIVTSAFGRRRRFPLIVDRFHKKEVERQAGNMAIQSTVNDLTLLAYTNIMKELQEAGIPRHPGMHIHDSANVSVPIPFWVEAVRIVAKAMSRVPFETDVPFPAEVEVGDRWGHMITVFDRNSKWAVLDPEDSSIPGWLRRSIPLEGA